MANVTVNGVSIHYQVMGRGPDVVLVHGLAANLGFWGPQLLLPLARRFRVTMLDLRGHGHSGMPACNYSTEDMALDLAGLLEYLGIRPASIVGHSFGGAVALHCAVLFPDLVGSLVLADTRIRVFQPRLTAHDFLQNEQYAAKLIRMGIDIPANEEEAGVWLLEQLALRDWRLDRTERSGEKIFVPFVGADGRNGSRTAKLWLELLQTTSAREDFKAVAGLTPEKIKRIRQPILSIYGENLNARQSSLALRALLPQCRTVVLQGAGHFFPLTHAAAFLGNVVGHIYAAGTANRRNYGRISNSVPFCIRCADGSVFTVPCLDISMGGMLIRSERSLEVGAALSVYPAANHQPFDISLQGKIVRCASEIASGFYDYGIRLTPTEGAMDEWQDYFLKVTRGLAESEGEHTSVRYPDGQRPVV